MRNFCPWSFSFGFFNDMNEKCILCKERQNLAPSVSYSEMICHYQFGLYEK